jgi:hypothetical protein
MEKARRRGSNGADHHGQGLKTATIQLLPLRNFRGRDRMLKMALEACLGRADVSRIRIIY